MLTDSDETEMFDHEEEDKDLDSQVAKGQPHATDVHRGSREETPGPQSEQMARTDHQAPDSTQHNSIDTNFINPSEKPDSTEVKHPKVIPESALPDKIVPQTATLEST